MKRHTALSPQHRRSILDFLRGSLSKRADVSFAFLHGSFADSVSPFRDIDIAIFLSPPPESPALAALDLKIELEDAIANAFEVDVQILNDAPLGFCFWASQGEVLICRDPEEVAQFREQTWLRYWDREPVLRHTLADLFGR